MTNTDFKWGGHANGRLENVKSNKDIKKIIKWVSSNFGISEIHGNIVFTSAFVKETHKIVFDLLDELIRKVKKQYPESIKESRFE